MVSRLKRLADAGWRPLALIVYATWLMLVGSHHQAWFDEGQVWLLARDNGLWPLLAERVRYEGTPGLWHGLVWLAIHTGLAYAWLWLMPVACAIAGGAIVLWRAPFPPALRIAVLVSYFFGYQFAVIARGYCLDLVLFPLAAVLFAGRERRPLGYAVVIGLIANDNAHGFLIGALLAIELSVRLLRAKSRNWRAILPALGSAAALGLFALWTAWQPADNDFLHPALRPPALVGTIRLLANAFVDRAVPWSAAPFATTELVATLLLTAFVLQAHVRMMATGPNRLLALALWVVLIAFSARVYASPWHSGLLFLTWLFLSWIGWHALASDALRREVLAGMMIVLLWQAPQTWLSGRWELTRRYSAGHALADEITAIHAEHPGGRIDALSLVAFEAQPWLRANAFANFHGGAPRPAYVTWERSDTWHESTPDDWAEAFRKNPDAVIVARRGFPDLPIMLRASCAAGYGIRRTFDAALVWRGRPLLDRGVYVFARGSSAGCAPNRAGS